MYEHQSNYQVCVYEYCSCFSPKKEEKKPHIQYIYQQSNPVARHRGGFCCPPAQSCNREQGEVSMVVKDRFSFQLWYNCGFPAVPPPLKKSLCKNLSLTTIETSPGSLDNFARGTSLSCLVASSLNLKYSHVYQ